MGSRRIPVRTTIPKAAQQLQTGVGEAIILFPDTDYKLKLHEATKGGVYTLMDFGAVVQISINDEYEITEEVAARSCKDY